MEKNKIFGQLETANLLLCLLLTVGVLPVLIWHSWGVLTGLSRVSLLGYGIADLALWSAAIWSASAPSPLIRGVALACKAALAGLLLLCAATVIVLHAGDQRRVSLAEESARLEARRLVTIAENAERLSVSSGRMVAREFLEAARASSPSPAPPEGGQAWREYLPEWWDTLGIVAVPPLAGLAVLVLLSAVIGLSGSPDPLPVYADQVSTVAAPAAPVAPALSPAFAQTGRGIRGSVPIARGSAAGPRPRFRVGFSGGRGADSPTPTPPASGGELARGAVRYETKRDGRTEAWLSAPDVPRGKVYLTSFRSDLSASDRAQRVQAALARKGLTG